MNKAPLILSVIALMISVLLLINNFTEDKSSKKHSNTETSTDSTKELSGDIAYVYIDSLIDSYDYYNLKKTMLINKQEAEGSKIETRYRTLQRKAMEMQKQVDSRMMTPTTAQKKQQELMMDEQQIMADKQNMELQLAEENQSMSMEVLDSIKLTLAAINEQHSFKLILSSTLNGGTVLLGDKQMDITGVAITMMNKRYKASKRETEAVKTK